MGREVGTIDAGMAEFIRGQRVFFVATAPLKGDGLINLSPKGLDSFRVLDERTVAYLVGQFKRLGLTPGNPDGTYVQTVPLIGFTGKATAAFDVKGVHMPLTVPDEAVVVSRQGLPDVSVAKAPMIFVGCGVVAPEFGWDDFKGADVRSKTIVILDGDPPVPDPANPAALDPQAFRGARLALCRQQKSQ